MLRIKGLIIILGIIVCGIFSSCTHSNKAVNTAPKEVIASDDTSDFVVITEVVPDVLLEIRYYSTYNFIGSRVDGYLEPTALLTRQAADSLRAVSDELKEQGYRLKIYDAYRPQMAVDHFVRWGADLADTLMKTYFYPDLIKDVLFDRGYIARRSSHSRGSTVDLTLFDMNTEKEPSRLRRQPRNGPIHRKMQQSARPHHHPRAV